MKKFLLSTRALLTLLIAMVAAVAFPVAQAARYSVNGGTVSCTTTPSLYRVSDTDTGFGINTATTTTGPCVSVNGTTRIQYTTTGNLETGDKKIVGNDWVTGNLSLGAGPFPSVGDARFGNTMSQFYRNSSGGNRSLVSTLGTNSDDIQFGDVSANARVASNFGTPTSLSNGNFWAESNTGAVTGTCAKWGARLNGATVYDPGTCGRTTIALDGSNPTSFAHNLGTATGCNVTLVGSAAPGLGTSTLTYIVNGANIDVYAWKPTGAGDTTLIASTGTETFSARCY